MVRLQSTWWSERNRDRPIESTQSSGLLPEYSSGRKKSLKVNSTENRATAAMAGLASRTTTVVRIRTSPQPSTRAASRYSSGIVRKNWRSRKIEKASPNQVGHDQRQQRAHQVQLGPEDVERHDRDLRRQHHRDQDQHEHRVPPAPSHPGERVGHRDARQQQAERREAGIDRRVCAPIGSAATCGRPRRSCSTRNGSGHRSRTAPGRGHQRGEGDEDERREEHDREAIRKAVFAMAEQHPVPAHGPRPLAGHDVGRTGRSISAATSSTLAT